MPEDGDRMTNEELIDAIRKEDRDNSLLMQLWNQNAGLIRKACRKFSGYIEAEDATQECFIAFTNAVNEYDPEAGQSFASFAFNRMVWHLVRYTDNNGPIRMPAYQKDRIRKYRRYVQQCYQKAGTRPADYDVCVVLDISAEQLRELRKDICRTDMRSLDAPISADSETTIADTVLDSETDIEEEAMQDLYRRERARAVWKAVDTLRPQEGEAIRLYYRDGMTYTQIGEAMGLSRERVRVILAQGIRQLRTGRRYKVLREFVDLSATYSEGLRGSLNMFNRTWTSSTESAAMKELERQRLQLIRMQQLRSDALSGGGKLSHIDQAIPPQNAQENTLSGPVLRPKGY